LLAQQLNTINIFSWFAFKNHLRYIPSPHKDPPYSSTMCSRMTRVMRITTPKDIIKTGKSSIFFPLSFVASCFDNNNFSSSKNHPSPYFILMDTVFFYFLSNSGAITVKCNQRQLIPYALAILSIITNINFRSKAPFRHYPLRQTFLIFTTKLFGYRRL